MRLETDTRALSQALDPAAGIAGGERPIMNGVLLEASADGKVALTATDSGTTYVCSSVPAEVAEPGSCVLPAKLLAKLLKKLKGERVSIEDDGRASCTVKCGARDSFTLHTLPAREFPAYAEPEMESTFTVPVDTLSEMAERTRRSVSADLTRAALCALLLDVRDGHATMVGCDSYRLAVADEDVDGSADFRALVPPSAVSLALSLAPKGSQVRVGLSGSLVHLEGDGWRVATARIGSSYPQWERLVPKEHATSATLPTSELRGALERAALVANQNPGIRMTVDVDGQLATVSSSSTDTGSGSTDIDVEAEGEQLSVGLNWRYLQDAVAPVKGDSVVVEASGPLKPVVARDPDGGYFCLVMPVHL